MNFLGLARSDAAAGETDRLEQDFDRLQTAAEKMHHLLEDLFEFSRVSLRANPPEEVAFGELVHTALTVLDGEITKRQAVVEVTPDLPTVRGDRPRLEELVRHLIHNALRYVDETKAPRIEIGMRRESDQLIFYVRDNGIGIDSRYHEKIFDLFERIHPEASEGTGVGLALARRVVEVYGGRIWVESEGEGQGSTFCMTFPNAKR